MIQNECGKHLVWIGGGSGEGAHKKNEPPPLIFRQPFLERGHGLSALTDLIENFAVRDGVHVPGVGNIGGGRVVPHGFGAIAPSALAPARCALLPVEAPRRLPTGIPEQGGVRIVLYVLRHNPPPSL